ncbi:tRNA (N(6)-L-threonylcarbamoyladenosine(37)-C(2))-methylthiotransferase MtaB [Sphingorhabdus sp. Alg239-R122]|uniref:tRNA (N(6)-L-threonylcarbamoyladenosine(37)-C(2))- methylthiotransferase MtaB n=1 Tax=Sphingorhabdus sp. Alg239-R122 TaxID=2305989 RepID=UPI001F079FC6|nr:tRNA (N(6)-L-threonylcarbamoyladenosine(37)-C(2))-methylthiotransferase MtaB [Sphingorhabdus sp. Alg239-R122]
MTEIKPPSRMKEGAEFVTMGCRLNIAETEAMKKLVPANANIVVVNSCAVTNEAVRQTRQAIRRAKRDRPDADVVVTGCAAQIHADMFGKMAEVDRVLGNREKLQAESFNSGDDAKIRVADIMRVTETTPHMATAFAEHSRAFVEVQNGCDHRCTFCIIPYGRGNSRSVPAGEVVEKVRELVDNGYQEVVLTGVDVTSYGHDLPGAPHFGLLVERILKLVPDLPRLRLSSLDGVEVDDRLFDLLTCEPRLMPHVHISLQSGDDMILKRMKRRHNRAQAIELVERLKAKRPEIAIGADIIAGFPTETEDMHRNNVAIVKECQVVHGHIFPFSPREGTPAARMPQLDRALIKQRAAEVRAAVSQVASDWRVSLIGSTQNMLVEKDGQTGHAENFAKLRLAGRADPGTLVPVRIAAQNNQNLIAETI